MARTRLDAEIIGDIQGFLKSLRTATSSIRDLQSSGDRSLRSLGNRLEGTRRTLGRVSARTQALSRSFNDVGTAGRRAGVALDRFGRQGAKSIDSVNRRVPLLTRAFRSFGQSLVVSGLFGVTRAITDTISDMAKLTLEVERASAEVSTLVTDTTVPLPQIISQVRALGASLGFAQPDSIRSLYQAISAGQEPANALEVVGASAKLAQAGLSSLTDSTNIVTTVLNAYNLSADKANIVTDVLFQTVRDGKTTVPELAKNLGKLIPIAAQAGVDLTEVSGAVAALTAAGLNTPQATTAVRAFLTSAIKPSRQAQAAAEELGIEFSAAAINAQGLVPFITNLRDRLQTFAAAGGDSQKALARLSGSVRATAASANLTGAAFEKFVNSTNNANMSLGQVDVAAGKIQKTLDNRLKVALETAKKEAVDLGSEFGKLATAILDFGKTGDGALGTIGNTLTTLKEGATTFLRLLTAGVRLLGGDAAEAQRALSEAAESAARAQVAAQRAINPQEAKVLDDAFKSLGSSLEEFAKKQDTLNIGQLAAQQGAIAKGEELERKRIKTLEARGAQIEEEKRLIAAEELLANLRLRGIKITPELSVDKLPKDLVDLFAGAPATARLLEVLRRSKVEVDKDGVERVLPAAVAAGANKGVREALRTGLKVEGKDVNQVLTDLFNDVNIAFGDAEAGIRSKIIALEDVIRGSSDPRQIQQASKAINDLQKQLIVFGNDIQSVDANSGVALRGLLERFNSFLTSDLPKINIQDLQVGVGKLFNRSLQGAPPIPVTVSDYFKQSVSQAPRAGRTVGRFLAESIEIPFTEQARRQSAFRRALFQEESRKLAEAVRTQFERVTQQVSGIVRDAGSRALGTGPGIGQGVFGGTAGADFSTTFSDALRRAIGPSPLAGLPGFNPVSALLALASAGFFKGTGGGLGFQQGGFVPGQGSGDRVPALLEPGEFVVPRAQAQAFGPLLEALRAGIGASAQPQTSSGLQIGNVTIVVEGAQGGERIADDILARLIRLRDLGQLDELGVS